MFHNLEKQVEAAFRDRVRAQYGIEAGITIEQPKQASFGEIALPIAFQLARELKQAPRKIAADLVAGAGSIPGIAAMEIAGNGYINIRFDRSAYALSLIGAEAASASAPGAGKIIVEHTNINPNKAAHIGHLRNAVLGDTFVRMLRALGHEVEVQNYIDNTGVQVADVVAGFHFLEHRTPAEVAELIANGQGDRDAEAGGAERKRFDYLCWDLYARISQHYKANPEALAWRAETLHAIEAGEGALAELGHIVADTIVNAHIATMLRLNIQYDVLPRESEILHLNFWSAAFELLKQRNAIYFETGGKNAGCWVMPSSAFRAEGDENEDSKVIVRSNGTVTYVGKDIAYQLWKFGLLGKDFYYRPLLRYTDGHELWVTSDEPQPQSAPAFGRGKTVYNVIDVRQSYLQDVVIAGLRALGFEREAENSIHFSYEMVALSPRCCVELGIELSEEDARRPYVEVSGRKGLGVKADDLMDRLFDTAFQEVACRHPEDNAAAQRAIATEIAMGALRYFLLKFTRNTVIAFDFQEALSFEGETGPYAQYAAVRARNIFRKLEERGETEPDYRAELTRDALERQLKGKASGDASAGKGSREASANKRSREASANKGSREASANSEADEFWQILLAASKADTAVERAVTAGEPSHVARYAFQLAQAFNNFYHQYPILAEPDREKKVFLLWMTRFFADQLERTLAILGIAVPAYM